MDTYRPTTDPSPGPGRTWPRGRLAGALAGIAAGASALAAGEVVAGVIGGAASPVLAIGALLIRLQPPGAKDVMVALFGTNDKVALDGIVVVAALAIAAGAGVLAIRRPAAGAATFAAAGLVAFLAGVTAPGTAGGAAAIGALASAGVGMAVLVGLLRVSGAGSPAALAAPPVQPPAARAPWGRRRFLVATTGTLVVAAVGARAGRLLAEQQHPTGSVGTTRLPAPGSAAPDVAADQHLAGAATPVVVPSDQFYRIDTALLVPRVDASTWRLRVSGLVDRPFSVSYDELLAMPLFEQYVTIACVSNPVGGDLVGNALWTGVHLRHLLEMAGVRPEATQVVGRSVDGFTAGFPTAWAMDPQREAMVAVGMNRDTLPAAHGYPARLIVPGLYGYVSATKWLSEIQLTTREAFDGYWVPLGWSKDAPILTQSRIDRPRNGETVNAGTVTVQGVAWAPDRGVAGVEVNIDGGGWQPARLARPISDATWVQWAVDWTAQPGRHAIEVRATDGTGATQTATRTEPAPDGARGHHRVMVTVA